MKVLYITRWNVPIDEEHVFIKSVWAGLSQVDGMQVLSILVNYNETISHLLFNEQDKIWTLALPSEICSDRNAVIKEIENAFKFIVPDIIHSNMQEGYELEAASHLSIPVLTTIHVGSVICPRGGNGLWIKGGEICDGKIGEKCIACCCDELPFSFIAKVILRIVPSRIKIFLNGYFNRHHTFFFTRLFNIENNLTDRQQYLQTLSQCYPIAANKDLYNLLKYYGCHPLLIPHGIKERNRLSFPSVDGKVKFYYVGRICYQKGLHIAIKAFKKIDKSLYEFHIIGESNAGRRNKYYFKKIMHDLKHINGFYHGYIANDKFDTYVKDWHVMIHPAICHEIYGLTIAEALSVGRPVLATKCCGSEMQVRDGENGWLITPNNPVIMRQKIMEILAQKENLDIIAGHCSTPFRMGDYIKILINNYYRLKNRNNG